ncbi:uncharacterized protein LOC113386932 [Ctenocephalides felis]|uniref:uncharacterized protein LOC113386932 n=1 Tax=Ctenocephalides felis TaxID=7515 RepID=UPI000E6E3CEE|nr:uncharacterized protein LOC113386932 [Ctenocephalides felis]
MNHVNALPEMPRHPPPCSINVKQVRFMGPSRDLELSTFELPRSPLVYTAAPVTKPSIPLPLPKTSQACQTETLSTVSKSCQTDSDIQDVASNIPVNDLVTMIQRQDQKLESLHEKLELILCRIDEKKDCSCNTIPSEADIPTISPPALDNVLGQVEMMLNTPRTPIFRNDLSIPKVDQSAAFDALAMKYLRGDEINKIAKPKKETDMSLATAAYLQRHRLPH